jgi:hypothetical protein
MENKKSSIRGMMELSLQIFDLKSVNLIGKL